MKQSILPLVALAFGLGSTASAQIGFDPAQSYFVGTRPDGSAAGDLDGDGDADLISTADAPDRVVMLANDGSGAFAFFGQVLTGAGTSPHMPAAGDLDGDGDTDIAVTLNNVNQVRILINMGGGAFTTGGSFAVGFDPRDMKIGDVDLDGDLDLVTSNRDGNSVSILRNSGSASFTVQTVPVGQDARELALGDWDGDGDLDAAVSAHDDRRVDVLTSSGGTFSLTQSIPFAAPHRPEGLCSGDLDGDGDTDLAGTSSDDAVASLNVASIMINTAGTFAPPFHFVTGGMDSSSIESYDLEGDGDVDLCVANQGSNDMSAMANGGGATFAVAGTYAVGAQPTHVVLGDLDGNGSPEAVTANELSNDVSVLMNQTGGPGAGPSLTLLAPAAIGTTTQIELSSPGEVGETYFCGFSGGTTPGITLSDGSVVPLNNDIVFQFALNPFNPIFKDTVGTFDASAQGIVTMNVPNNPGIVGTTIFSAFVVVDATSPTGFGTISPALAITAVL